MPADAESMAGWVVRTAPPAAEPGRDVPMPRSEPVPPAAPASAPAVESRPAPSTQADKPAEPVKLAPDAPEVVPNSDVRWLLPQEVLQGWASGTAQDSAQTQGGLLSGLKSAALKFSQWLGWSDAGTAPPNDGAAGPGDGEGQA